jgi:hypothetical protein
MSLGIRDFIPRRGRSSGGSESHGDRDLRRSQAHAGLLEVGHLTFAGGTTRERARRYSKEILSKHVQRDSRHLVKRTDNP